MTRRPWFRTRSNARWAVASAIVLLVSTLIFSAIVLAALPWPLSCPRDMTDPIAVQCAKH